VRRSYRAWALVAGLLLVALGYVALVPSISEDLANTERHLGASPAGDGVPQLGLYVEVVGVDPVNQTVQLRFHATPNRALRGGRPDTSGRDLTVRIDDGDTVRELAFRAGEPIPPTTMDATLNGSTIALYPLERFQVALQVTAREGFHPPDDPVRPVPVGLSVWEAIGGWTLGVTEEPGGGTGEVRLRFSIWRTGALAFLALALYAVMVLIAGAALTMGSLIFLRVRKVEATLAGLLSGMLFALPAMRYALPGSPPLGVRADLLVFLWAELAVAIGLLLFVLAWIMGGPRE
jgi:hypothetical protein